MFGGRNGTANTDEPVVVSKYTKTKQRWLRAKIVKSGDRHYKKGDLNRAQGGRRRGNKTLKEKPQNRKQALRKERKKKDKRKKKKNKKNKERKIEN